VKISGFDPLCSGLPAIEGGNKESIGNILESSIKSTVNNILKSYTGYFDIFSEMIQNSMDSTQKKFIAKGNSYIPRLWIYIDLKQKSIRLVDNGIGMNLEEFLLCFRPNVSFKRGDNLRGNKGVGATFLAYGFNYISLQTKNNGCFFSSILRQGRQWVDDTSDRIPRPLLEEQKFDVPELLNEESGTVFENQVNWIRW